MRRQLVPGPVVRLTVIKAKTRPGIEASLELEASCQEIEDWIRVKGLAIQQNILDGKARQTHAASF